MNRKHALTISLGVGMAAIAGAFAATKTIHLGHPAAATTPTASPSAQIARRTKQLDRAEAALRKALRQQPPKLPPLPATTPAPAAGSPVAATVPAQQAAQRIVYVRPAPRVVTVHRSGGEHEDGYESGSREDGGGFDD